LEKKERKLIGSHNRGRQVCISIHWYRIAYMENIQLLMKDEILALRWCCGNVMLCIFFRKWKYVIIQS